jgi:hypothetical protein
VAAVALHGCCFQPAAPSLRQGRRSVLRSPTLQQQHSRHHWRRGAASPLAAHSSQLASAFWQPGRLPTSTGFTRMGTGRSPPMA